MGVKIYPSRVRQKAESMNRELETLKECIAVEREAQSWLGQKFLSLSGHSWDSARRYIEEIQLPLLVTTVSWIEAEMGGNKTYQTAATRLPQVDCLDEDQLKHSIERWKDDIEDELRDEDPNHRRISHLRSYINDAYAKLGAMSIFVSTTRGIYDRARDINRILKKADTELNKVQYEPKTMMLDFTSVNRNWILEMEPFKVLEQLKADGLTDEDFRELSELGFTVEQISAAWEEMKEQGISRADLKDMKTLGYSFARTVEMWSSLETKEDKHFFACLIQGQGNELKYAEAFAIDPNELSYGATIAMTEYAYLLLGKAAETGGNNEFEKNFIAFNNDLLNSSKGFNDIMPDGSEIASPKKIYRDVYLERVFSGTAVLLDVDTGRLLEAKIGNMADDEYEKLVTDHKLKLNMCGYWAMQKMFIGKEGIHTDDNLFYIADITNYGGGIDFNLGYHSGYSFTDEIAEINMTAANSTDLDDKWDLKQLEALRESKENLLREITLKAVQSGAVLGLSYIAPELAIFASLGTMVMNGSAGTVTGLDSLSANELGKMGLKSGNILAANGINYVIQLNELSSKIDDGNYKKMMKWFGKGVNYNIGEEGGVAFAGFYDPEKLYTLNRFNTEGLAKMEGWDSDDTKDIIDKINDNKDISQEVKAICNSMINGGYQVLEQNENGYSINISNMENFLKAVDKITEAKKDVNETLLPEGIRATYFK